MTSLDDLRTALQNADAAGDTTAATALANEIVRQTMPGNAPPAASSPSFLSDLHNPAVWGRQLSDLHNPAAWGRQLGLTARAAANGVAEIPNAIGDATVGGVNALSGSQLPLPSAAFGRTLDRLFPTPQTGLEKVVNAGAAAMIPAAGSVGLGRVAPLLAPLADYPVTQLLSGAAGAASSQAAQDAGAPRWVQMGAGILGGVAGPTALTAANAMARAALRVPGSLLAPFSAAGRANNVARVFQTSATNPQYAAAKIQGAPQYVPGVNPTTAELANDSGLSGLYKTLRTQNNPVFSDIDTANDAARQAYLAQTFGNQTDLDAAKAAREAATAPLRDQALTGANAGAPINAARAQQIADLQSQAAQKAQSKIQALQNAGQLQTQAAQQDVFSNNFTPVAGMPRVPASLSPNLEQVAPNAQGAQQFLDIAAQREQEKQALQSAAQSIAAQGQVPSLQSAPLVQSIQSTLNQPGLRASDVVQKTLGDIQAKIAQYTRPDGTIDANDLYTIRKEIGNSISGFAKESNNWDKRLTGGLQDSIQGQIDKAIVGAGGVDWPSYLQAYRNASQQIDGMQLGQQITQGATNPITDQLSPAKFSRQFSNNAPDIAAAGPQYSDALTRVNEDLKRSVAPMNAMRTAGSDTAQNLAGAQVLNGLLGRIPGSAVGRVAGKLLSVAYSPAEAQTKQLMLNAMMDPNLGRQMLLRPLPARADLVGGLLSKLLPISYGGLLGTMSAQ